MFLLFLFKMILRYNNTLNTTTATNNTDTAMVRALMVSECAAHPQALAPAAASASDFISSYFFSCAVRALTKRIFGKPYMLVLPISDG